MVLDELASLVATATGLTVASSLFQGRMPEAPDVCAALIEYPGASGEATFGEPITIERPKIQLLFRAASEDYASAREMAETAYQALRSVANQTVEGTRWLAAQPLQPPFPLKVDAQLRPLVAFNLLVEKELSS